MRSSSRRPPPLPPPHAGEGEGGGGDCDPAATDDAVECSERSYLFTMSDIALPCRSRAKRFSCERAVPAGGARRDRTDDLLLAKQALSQLSYGPVKGQRSDISDQNLMRAILITDP